MKITNYFEMKRFWLLLKVELYRSRKGLLMTLVICFGLMFFLGLLLSPVFMPGTLVFDHSEGFTFSLLVGGFILSSLAFNDLSNRLRRYHYLTLPVSSLEKFLCMWLLTTVGWILLFTFTYTLYTWFANAFGRLIFRHITFLAFNPLGMMTVTSMKYYLAIQGIFLAGAAHFRGYVFPKTLFSIILFGAVCGLITYFLMADMFSIDEELFSHPNPLIKMPVYTIWIIVQWLFWWILAPLCWVITYLGLKEKEE
jgi:hypothetical protein